ncbi:glycoside hydrolase family 43 protein [Marinibactrum halimedae]|uniref:Glycoside hydrolase 43 family protein n=1 Tax=Marinibactrum halimedae TaxID=1444977 RepID=A0AA37WLS8_9GAMM|nr:glycoside hydrolase family 43 protein [Marinibactrum halimedae]MCD9458681.1 glycoside hydrolase family 43 protein [Marinibactrum halimedae]GLS25953.1 glycoside hydrolase 43 family protein [Marinibactrum halimedae]
MNTIKNPILPGFNPDPSICRVGEDYYIATSTFEWFPGIQIHHSKDLVNWRLLTRALSEVRLLDLTGIDNSGGCWAPALTHADGKFWLTYANMRAFRGGSWMSPRCYLITADSIEGPWSDPVSINAFGFDPSIFHDDDGKKYILNMIWDGRLNKNFFGGIVLQEYDPIAQKNIGEIQTIFHGTECGFTEGPQMFKKDGYYYLVTAEGGTGFHHAVTVCRSRNIAGPYEVHPNNPVITSEFKGDAPLQRTGHGFFVETQSNEWYMSHLLGRPVDNPEGYNFVPKFARGFSILGRESGLQKIKWENDWPYLYNGTNTGELNVIAPDLPAHPWPSESLNDDFESDQLNPHFQSLRQPIEERWCSLKARQGYLRLTGRDYLYSNYDQSFIARRIQHFEFSAETELDYSPEYIQQMAGLVVYYDKGNHYFLKVSIDDNHARTLQIVGHINDQYNEYGTPVVVPDGPIKLKVTLGECWYQFYWQTNSGWSPIGPKLNATCLSDEFGDDIFRFTGSFVGIFAADVSGLNKHADFSYFYYSENSQ